MSRLEKTAKGINRLQTGCMFIFINLFLGGFCLWGGYMLYVSYQLQANGRVTEGIVVSLDESNSDNGKTYSPIIEFETGGGVYSFKGNISSNPPKYEVGERVEVRYDPADPQTAQIENGFEKWLTPLILIPSTVITALILNFFLIRAWRKGEGF